MLREKLKDSDDPKNRPLLDLTWYYPTSGQIEGPSAEAVLSEISGWDATGQFLSAYKLLKADGSTACGCWIYCGVFGEDENKAARKKPHWEQNYTALEWAWAWPANRRLLYSRASADPEGNPWSERKRYVWWDPEQEKWVGHDHPDFTPSKRPDYVPDWSKSPQGMDAIDGKSPFIMIADGKCSLFVPA